MTSPVFIQIENYDDVLTYVDDLKRDLLSARSLLEELHDLRTEENELIHVTQSSLDEMRLRFAAIQKGVFDQ